MKLLTFISLVLTIVEGTLSCIGDNGNAVDNWFLIKQPKGFIYMYSDPGVMWGASLHTLNSTHAGALGVTLGQLWDSSNDYIMFNDEPLGVNVSSAIGHTKAIWAWSGNTGFILTHSVPLFPAGPSLVRNYSGLGDNAYTYAQHMACFSTTTVNLNRLAIIATLTVPGVYDMRIGMNAPSGLRDLANGVRNKNKVCNHTWFQTIGGRNITYFAKSSQWNNELYSACVTPVLKTSLVVESWIRGSVEGPYCGLYAVLDVKLLNFSAIGWKESQDHSKWAVGIGSPWVCASDINRMLSQYGRGGSAFCYEDATMAEVLNDAITSSDSCALPNNSL